MLSLQNLAIGIAVLGGFFNAFLYLRKPQEDADKKEALVSQKLQIYMTASDLRFKEMQNNFKDLLLQSNNHIHTVDTKVEALSGSIDTLGKDVVRLSTVIEERIPKKKK